jgi:hypothetical protein
MLQEELNKLKMLSGTDSDKFIAQYEFVFEKFSGKEDRKIILDFVDKMMKESAERTDNFIEEAKIKLQLSDVSKIISLSYVAETYFNKTRNWLYQKVNGSIVNGKPAKFTPVEIDTLNKALQDIGKKIGSTVISL